MHFFTLLNKDFFLMNAINKQERENNVLKKIRNVKSNETIIKRIKIVKKIIINQ